MQNDNNGDFHTYRETREDLGESFIAICRQSGCHVIYRKPKSIVFFCLLSQFNEQQFL